MSFGRAGLYFWYELPGRQSWAVGYRGTKIGYRGTVTRYFFSTVVGTVNTFLKMYRFWYCRYFLDGFPRLFR